MGNEDLANALVDVYDHVLSDSNTRALDALSALIQALSADLADDGSELPSH